ncbi:MFS transporter, partial [Nanoarchaeota archaeon]
MSIKRVPTTRTKLIFFIYLISAFIAFISSPLIAIYLLRILEFSYLTYMIITMSGTVFSLVVMELWGKFADKFGNYQVLKISLLFFPLMPILWILSGNPIYLVLVPSALGGIYLAGFGLATSNFIYDNVSQQKRGLAVSYFNLLVGIGAFLGAGLSAILIKYVNTSMIKPLFLIFII